LLTPVAERNISLKLLGLLLAIKSVLIFKTRQQSQGKAILIPFYYYFLFFVSYIKKQIDPNDIGKVRKNLKEKNEKQKNNGAMSNF
jgi:hypothetical protein